MEEDAAFAAAQSGQVDLAYTAAPYAEQSIDGFELFHVVQPGKQDFASVGEGNAHLPLADHSPTVGVVLGDLAPQLGKAALPEGPGHLAAYKDSVLRLRDAPLQLLAPSEDGLSGAAAPLEY